VIIGEDSQSAETAEGEDMQLMADTFKQIAEHWNYFAL
jgi:hypothetical protein